MFCECKWKDNVNFGVLDELKKKADFVEWNKQKRKDYFILFAKLFEQEFKKHSEENNILCVDLKYIEQFFKRMKTKDIKFFRQFFKAYANGFYSTKQVPYFRLYFAEEVNLLQVVLYQSC